jgi:hypothetical protein
MNQRDALLVIDGVYRQTKQYPSVLWSTHPAAQSLRAVVVRPVRADWWGRAIPVRHARHEHRTIEWRPVSEGPVPACVQSGYVDFGLTEEATRCTWWLSDNGTISVGRPRPVADSRDFYYHGNDAKTHEEQQKHEPNAYLAKMYQIPWNEKPLGPYEKMRYEADLEIAKQWTYPFSITKDELEKLGLLPRKPTRDERLKAQTAPELKQITEVLNAPVSPVQQQCQRCRTQWRKGTYGLELSPVQIAGAVQFTCPNCG